MSRHGKGQASDRKSVWVGIYHVRRELCGPVSFSSCKIAGWTIHCAGVVILRMHSRRPLSVMQKRSAPRMGLALSRGERASRARPEYFSNVVSLTNHIHFI